MMTCRETVTRSPQDRTLWGSFICSAFIENLLMEPVPGQQGIRQGPDMEDLMGVWGDRQPDEFSIGSYLEQTFTEQLLGASSCPGYWGHVSLKLNSLRGPGREYHGNPLQQRREILYLNLDVHLKFLVFILHQPSRWVRWQLVSRLSSHRSKGQLERSCSFKVSQPGNGTGILTAVSGWLQDPLFYSWLLKCFL